MPGLRSIGLTLLAAALAAGRVGAAPVPPQNEADREVHVVGVYEGDRQTGRVAVHVDRPGKFVTLVLTAYHSVAWDVTTTPETRVERVVLGGYERQAVAGVPAGAVEECFRGGAGAGRDRPYLPYTYDADTVGFRAIVERVGEKPGCRVASFTGAYSPGAGVSFVVNRVQNDPRFTRDFPEVAPAADLPKLRFAANLYTPGGDRFQTHTAFGEFTPLGPDRKTMRPLPDRAVRAALDPKTGKYYGVTESGHAVGELDLGKRTTRKLEPGPGVPRLSWVGDVTFDTKRQRLLVSTCGGGGHLYACDPATNTWAVLSSKPGIIAMTYHPGTDAIYGLNAGGFGKREKPSLVRFNENGAAVESKPLAGDFVPGTMPNRPGVSGAHLVAAGDSLALILMPRGYREEGARLPAPRSYLYVVDPSTAKARLGWKE